MNHMLVGLDTAKDAFHLVLSDRPGHIKQDKRLTRRHLAIFIEQLPKSTIVMEACGSSYYWARTFARMGHEVVLLPAHDVKRYVHPRSKTDRADAKALLEAYRNDEIKPVPIKTIEQQVIMSVHAGRALWMKHRTAAMNSLRGMLREHGFFLRKGARHLVGDATLLIQDGDVELPGVLRRLAAELCDQIRELEQRVELAELQLAEVARNSEYVQGLMRITGIGLITATAVYGFAGDLRLFPTARHFASYLGLVPKESSSGNTRRLGRISKAGNSYLRHLLVHGARAALAGADRTTHKNHLQRWILALKARANSNKAAVALANKIARIIWVVTTRGVTYDPDRAVAHAA